MTTARSKSRTELNPLIASYAPPNREADELLDTRGALRPVWTTFVDHLSQIKSTEIAGRFARGDQHLRDAGVFYRQYGNESFAERDWPLSHIPVLISEKEWREISAGLMQRADLLEAVAADLYGANRLVAQGHLPASLVAQNPEWLRPLVGVKPRSGHFLHFLAFEIGRGPDGRWWVLGDRTQAPSGAGFALENRVATARVFPDLFRQTPVHRLHAFFNTLRDSLENLQDQTSSRVGILTPGPMNDTYYEQAYIARYLGFSLVEGEDLTVSNNRLMFRTVAGAQPVSVVWRRLDAAWVDPLELKEDSQLGTPGLVDAVRHGTVTLVNALGVGVLESRVMLAFMPRFCEILRNEALAMPNIATWWCGQKPQRDYVRQNIKSMNVGPALSNKLPFELEEETLLGGEFRSPDHVPVDDWLESSADHLVGQESVSISTTPAYVDGKLEPRPMSLRMFLVRTPGGWTVMPGGFARIGAAVDATALALSRGASVADVWIVGDRPAATESAGAPPNIAQQRARRTTLPSRAADNLYWLGRYLDRAEFLMRVTRAYHARLAETDEPNSPLLDLVERHCSPFETSPVEAMPEGLLKTLDYAVGSAGKIRDRLSVDAWLAISDLDKSAFRLRDSVLAGDDAAHAMGILMRKVTGISGLVHENMYRFTGWRFLSIGRSLERAQTMAGLLARFADASAPEGSLDLALEVGDSDMTHRRRFTVATTRDTVVDLLALDAMNPRSCLYHLTEIQQQIQFLPGHEQRSQMTALSRAVLQTHSGLAVLSPQDLDGAALLRLRGDTAHISDLLTESYLR